MRVSVYLVIAQWALLAAFGTLVIVMYRQLGLAFHRPKSEEPLGPPLGTQAAPVEYAAVRDGLVRTLTPGDGKPTLLAFVDPTCPSCEHLVDAMGEADAAGEFDGVRVLLLVSDPPSYLEISKSFRETPLEIGQLRERRTLEAYKANATPLLVAIDGSGVVRSAGPAVHPSEVRSFTRACVASGGGTSPLDVVMSTPAELTSSGAGPGPNVQVEER
jgi:hypothetical protein